MAPQQSTTYSTYALTDLVDHSSRLLHKTQAKELTPFGISPEELATMKVIHHIGDGATPGKISRHLFTEAHSTSELLVRMEKKKLVTRTHDLEKKNWVRVALTPKGDEIYRQTVKLQPCRKILSCLSREE